MGKKIEANNTLCASGKILPLGCCIDIASEVKKYIAAYEALCLKSSGIIKLNTCHTFLPNLHTI
jgi:hypothetical protein